MRSHKKLVWLGIFCLLLFQVSAVIIMTNASSSRILTQIKNIQANLTGNGIESYRLQDLSQEAESALETGDYKGFLFFVHHFEELAETIEKTDEKITGLENDLELIKVLDIAPEGLKSSIEEARFDFQLENYEKSAEKVSLLYAFIENLTTPFISSLDHALGLVQYNLSLHNLSYRLIADKRKELQGTRRSDFVSLYEQMEEVKKIEAAAADLLAIKENLGAARALQIDESQFEDYLQEAAFRLRIGDYNAISDLKDESDARLARVNQLQKEIASAHKEIQALRTQDLDPSQLMPLYEKAESALLNAEFESAEERLQELRDRAYELKTEAVLFGIINKQKIKFDFIAFVKTHWTMLILSILLVLLMHWILSKRVLHWYLKKKIQALEHERTVLIEMIKSIQKQYFINKTISRKKYEAKLESYQKRMIEITRELPLSVAKLQGEVE